MLNTHKLILLLAFSAPLHAAPKMVTLVARDGATQQVSDSAAMQSSYLKEILENTENTSIPLATVENGEQLSLFAGVLQDALRKDSTALESNIDHAELCVILSIAHYLDVPGLLQKAAKCIAGLACEANYAQIQNALPFETQNIVAYHMLAGHPLDLKSFENTDCIIMPLHNARNVQWQPLGDQILVTTWRMFQVWQKHQDSWALKTNITGNRTEICLGKFSDDGSTIAALMDNNQMQIWRVQNGQWVRTAVLDHTQRVWRIAISSDGANIMVCTSEFVSGVLQNVIAIWEEGASGNWSRSAILPYDWQNVSAAWHPLKTQVLIGSGEKVSILERNNHGEWKPIASLPAHSNVTKALWSPEGTKIAVTTACVMYIWGKSNNKWQFINRWDWYEHGPDISVVGWSPDSTRIAAVQANMLKIFDTSEQTSACIASIYLDRSIQNLIWSPDSKMILIDSYERVLYEEQYGQWTHTLSFPNSYPVGGKDFSPDGNTIVLCAHDVELWYINESYLRERRKKHFTIGQALLLKQVESGRLTEPLLKAVYPSFSWHMQDHLQADYHIQPPKSSLKRRHSL